MTGIKKYDSNKKYRSICRLLSCESVMECDGICERYSDVDEVIKLNQPEEVPDSTVDGKVK